MVLFLVYNRGLAVHRYSKMHNGTVAHETSITLGTASSTRTHTPVISADSNARSSGASSDLTLHLDLPSTAAMGFELRVLAGHAPTSNATSILVNVSAAVPQRPRKGLVSVTPSFAPKRAHAQEFDVRL